MFELKSIARFWSTHRLDKDCYVIHFPTVDAEQITRNRHWVDYLSSCAELKIKPNKTEFEKIYCGQTEPDGAA